MTNRVKLVTVFSLLTAFLLGHFTAAYSQQRHKVSNLSKKFDLVIDVQTLDEHRVSGKFSIYRKGAKRPFQIIRHNETDRRLSEDSPRFVSVSEKQNGKWSSVYFEDFNFDGNEDLAIADGSNGGYRGTSYRIYLFDRSGRFVFSPSLTRLAQGPYIGIPEPDRKMRTLEVFWKSGAGFYQIERYKFIKNRPRKIYEYSKDSMAGDGNAYITTKKWVNGRWRVWNKTVKDENQ